MRRRGQEYPDYCSDEWTLKESTCVGPQYKDISCPAGCLDGACICPDSDGGLNFEEYGELDYVDRDGTEVRIVDECVPSESGSSRILMEAYCGFELLLPAREPNFVVAVEHNATAFALMGRANYLRVVTGCRTATKPELIAAAPIAKFVWIVRIR